MASIGRYRIVRPLGEGGMGVVHLCVDDALGREVAVKVLKGGSERARTRFVREAKALASLDHPGVLRVHEIGAHDGAPFIVMDYVTGRDLLARVKATGPLPPREAAEIMRQVAGILGYVHGQGILHRDLKPENVMITADGKPMLLDFGLCKTIADDSSMGGLTAPGSGLGSLGYMPPEQLDNALHADVLSDVYGLGATLYALLVGRVPYPGKTTRSIIMDTLKGNAPPPSTLRPDIDPALDTICARAMRVAPCDRYPSAQAFEQELERFLSGQELELPADPISEEDISLGDVLGALMLKDSFEDAQDPDGDNPSPSDIALVGDGHVDAGDFKAAVASYEKALRDRPTDTTIRLRLAFAYRRGGDSVSALDQYDAVLARDPRDRRAYVARGAARTDLKDFIGAVADFERALELYPPDDPKAKRIRQALRRASGRLGDTVMRPGRRPG